MTWMAGATHYGPGDATHAELVALVDGPAFAAHRQAFTSPDITGLNTPVRFMRIGQRGIMLALAFYIDGNGQAHFSWEPGYTVRTRDWLSAVIVRG